jgi:hypothetical protein
MLFVDRDMCLEFDARMVDIQRPLQRLTLAPRHHHHNLNGQTPFAKLCPAAGQGAAPAWPAG